MDRVVLILVALAATSTGCIDWDSLYATAPADPDAGGDTTSPDAGEQPGDAAGCSDGVNDVVALDTPEGGEVAIVACGGSWAVPGVHTAETTCGRQAGDDGGNTSGEGCSISDLCAEGWHVCLSADDVSAHQGAALCERLRQEDSALYVTGQVGGGDGEACSPDGNNEESRDDVYGCGTLGIEAGECAPLDRRLALTQEGDEQGGCPLPFHCGDDTLNEASNLTKSEPTGGGVLCCRD